MTLPVEPPPSTYGAIIADIDTQFHDPQTQRREILDIIRELDDSSLNVLVAQNIETSISQEENQTLLQELATHLAEAEPEFKQAGQRAAKFYGEVDQLFEKLKMAVSDTITTDTIGTQIDISELEKLRGGYRCLVFESSELAVKASVLVERFYQVIVPLCEDDQLPSEIKVSKLNKLIEEGNTFTRKNSFISERLDGLKQKFVKYVETLGEVDRQHYFRHVQAKDEILRLRFDLKKLDEQQKALIDSETLLSQTFRHVMEFVNDSAPVASNEQLVTMVLSFLCERGVTFAIACSCGAIQIKRSRILEKIHAANDKVINTRQERSRLGTLIENATQILENHSNTLKNAWADTQDDAIYLQKLIDEKTSQEQIRAVTITCISKKGAYKSMASYLRSYADTIHANHERSSQTCK